MEDGFYAVNTPTEEFSIRVLPNGSTGLLLDSSEEVRIVLVLGDRVSLRNTTSGDDLELYDGGAALIPPNTGPYRVERNHAAIYAVSVGASE
jgi:mannose-6-phosphate isomerase class I